MELFEDQVKTFSDLQQCINWIASECARLGSQVAFNRYRVDDKLLALSPPAADAVCSKVDLYVEMQSPRGGPSLIDSFLNAMPVTLTLKCFSVPQFELCVIFAANQTLADVSLFCARFLDEVLNMRPAN
jgi:hypothetical protein